MAFTKTTDTFNKNKRCHMDLEGLSIVCAKLQPTSSKDNEIHEINVLQKFTFHAFYSCIFLGEFCNFLLRTQRKMVDDDSVLCIIGDRAVIR